jgi:hypothetical protein
MYVTIDGNGITLSFTRYGENAIIKDQLARFSITPQRLPSSLSLSSTSSSWGQSQF